MNDEYILKAEKISKTYSMGTAKVQVLNELEFSVRKGEFVAIIGASGSGKSTLLHLFGALDNPDVGKIYFNDADLNKYSFGQLNEYRNRKVGFVFQFYHLLTELNVVENVYLPAMAASGVLGWLGSKNTSKTRAKQLLIRFGLADRLAHKPFQLSGGERQRVAIARALMNQPDVLLADEPTGNLDWNTGTDILNVLKELNEAGQTIVMVTHDARIAQQAQRTVRLEQGRIVPA